MTAVPAIELKIEWYGENASFIVNVLRQTDTTKKFLTWFAFNYLWNKWNDATTLHDLSSSYLPRKTSTSGNELAIPEPEKYIRLELTQQSLLT
jgi:hypothetical protein